jgi:hypothetical protein
MNQESERSRQDLYMRIGAMKDSKTKPKESTHLAYTYTGVSFLPSYILGDIRFAE